MRIRESLSGLRERYRWSSKSNLNAQYRYGLPNRLGDKFIDAEIWSLPGMVLLVAVIGALLSIFLISVPFTLHEQFFFSLVFGGLALYIRRYVGTLITLILIFMSLIVSTRYIYWRLTETFSATFDFDLLFGAGLIIAELYAWLVLVIGFFQTIWPLKRKPVPLPEDTTLWPSVDIFIPSYNEPLSVVRPTVIAAMALDWPRDKLKVYILDDGRRDEFREFSESVGVTHVVRSNNFHAKAGNINAALPNTHGELIAIFDCDHIPTRSFLQMTVGWFLKEKQLAMVQTPHHFISPDPFERNLDKFRMMPNEGELFYGLVQDGNDMWNATFFCGSCALIRRDRLLEVGGIAVETVTEDAHTALKLHRLGYTTAYLGIVQAAGLATESLSAHVGQRIRWARGMAQIFRVDNPVLGRGLTLPQRLCYANAMMHFFYGIPRIIFLTAPLSYMFFQAHVIQASADLIAVYALPHLIHANVANSRIQGKYRHTFWAEVYETALAWYILLPTTVAVINPKLGKFNVTAKGGMVEREYFDWQIAVPYLTILGLNLLGLGIGIIRLFWWNADEWGTVLLNLLWTIYNLMLLFATLAVAFETKQIRRHWRVNMKLPAMVRLQNGRTMSCNTEDFSEGGFALRLPAHLAVEAGEHLHISIFRGDREFSFPSVVAYNNGHVLRIKFDDMHMEDYQMLVAATFSRGDAWQEWLGEHKTDHPLTGLKEVFQISITGFTRFNSLLGEYIKKYYSSIKARREQA